jgi:hypothetical protein
MFLGKAFSYSKKTVRGGRLEILPMSVNYLYLLTRETIIPQPNQKITDRYRCRYRSTKNTYLPFSSMSPKKQNATNFRFVTERFIFDYHHQLTRSQFERVRGDLPKSIFWIQPSGKGGRVLWNLPLFLSFMAMGSESPQTIALVDEYLSSLPQPT